VSLTFDLITLPCKQTAIFDHDQGYGYTCTTCGVKVINVNSCAVEMESTLSKLTFDDWTNYHRRAAARQGWQLVETDFFGSAVMIRGIDLDAEPDVRLEFNSGSNTDDEKAMMAMKLSYLNREDHGVLAYNIIKNQSVMEFNHWAMDSWKEQKTA